jgi:hypothetical protein
MPTNPYNYVLLLLSSDGQPLAEMPLAPHWESAIEWTRLTALRAHPDTYPGNERGVRIEPVLDPAAEPPYCSGFRVVVAFAEDSATTCEFPIAYFSDLAERGAMALVSQGYLQSKAKLLYVVAAYPGVEKPPTPHPAFIVRPIEGRVPLKPLQLSEMRRMSIPRGEQDLQALPIFIPQNVIQEVEGQTVQAGAVETGGILIGHLCHDRSLGEIAVVVTAQIPAQHAQGELCNLTFTPDTWTAVHEAIRLRRSDEIMVGWWHSHPEKFWSARESSPDLRADNPPADSFFSADDIALHQTVFPKAYNVALVVTNHHAGPGVALYGWIQGVIRRRGFQIILKREHSFAQTLEIPCTENHLA